MTFEQRLAIALSYAKRQGIRMTPQREAQIAAKIREKMARNEAYMQKNKERADKADGGGGVKPYQYGTLSLSRIEDRSPVKGGDLYVNIQNSEGCYIISMKDGTSSHTFMLPASKLMIGA